MKEEKIVNTTLENQEIEEYFNELEIIDSICKKINWKNSKFNYLEITNSKLEYCIFTNLNL